MITAQLAEVAQARHSASPREFLRTAQQLLGMRSAAALDFGEMRGWKLSPSYVALSALVDGARHTTTRSRWVYRPAGWRCAAEYSFVAGYRVAAAIALHVRDWPEVKAGWRAAVKFGLVVELPDYPA